MKFSCPRALSRPHALEHRRTASAGLLCLGLVLSAAQIESAHAAWRPSRDTSAPSVPGGVSATAASTSAINLAWTAATDNVGVKGYKIYRGGSQIATVTGTSFSNTGLTSGKSYSYTVAAYDAAGNSSKQSSSVSATTSSADTTAPTVPGGLAATAVSSSSISLSWNASTDAVGVQGYTVYRNGVELASVAGTTFSDSGLSPNTTYQYTVSAYDAAGNRSAQSASSSATTDSSGGGSGGGGGGSAGGVPAGIYSIDTVVDKPFVDGVLIRVYWSQVEKTEGKYDFSKVASVIKQAQALGQGVSIANMVVAEPSWLLNKTETFSDPQFGVITAPWDTTMLDALEKYITAFSNYQVDGIAIKDHPTVRQVDAAIGGIQSIRMMQPPSGYTAQKLEDGVLRSVRAWVNAFPNKHIYAGLFGVNDGAKNPSTVEAIRDDLMAEFDGVSKPKLNFFQEVLTGMAPTLNSPLATIVSDVKNETSIMYQACGEWKNQSAWSWCYWANNDSPDAGFSFAYNNFNTTYFEIYQTDLMNDAYASQFQKWHDTLKPYLP
ncbi:fibronectin type III domain-containing protein [Methylosarcina fibrata]|uniref:fibronectin type III domain-containing protein n=1 Tax=Methylosarcina fibrata TaxID=105972 RepID=UPI000374F541|nr:fibronectin type III domain-containing protein [Methylosarcina fibrata]